MIINSAMKHSSNSARKQSQRSKTQSYGWGPFTALRLRGIGVGENPTSFCFWNLLVALRPTLILDLSTYDRWNIGNRSSFFFFFPFSSTHGSSSSILFFLIFFPFFPFFSFFSFLSFFSFPLFFFLLSFLFFSFFSFSPLLHRIDFSFL